MSHINWAGNVAYRAARVIEPDDVETVQESVRTSPKVHAYGSRHSFNEVADTDGVHLALHRLDRMKALDASARQVTFQAGARYGELCPLIHSKGFAFHNLASLPHISVVGACATATHGSGSEQGNLATAISALEFVDAAGDLVTLTRDGSDAFAGAVVGLGTVGVVTQVTHDIVPAFDVRQDLYLDLPYDVLDDHFEDVMGAGYSVSLFTDWRGDAIGQVWVKRMAAADDTSPPEASFFGARPATEKLHPLAGHDALACTDQLGVPGAWFARLPHFRMDFTPSSGAELQAEYFVAREDAPAAARAIRAIGHLLEPVLMVSEVRTIAADELWLSPCYRRPSAAFHFTCRLDWPALADVLPHVEAALAPFDPRPHWGKLFTMPPERVAAAYERMADFRDLAATYDPDGKFRNALVDRYVFGGG